MAAYNIDNKSKDVRRAIAKLKQLNAAAETKEKAAFGGMFGKVSMYDNKRGVLVPNANGDNPHVFFDIKQGEQEDLGRIVMHLCRDITPKTAERTSELYARAKRATGPRASRSTTRDDDSGQGFHQPRRHGLQIHLWGAVRRRELPN